MPEQRGKSLMPRKIDRTGEPSRAVLDEWEASVAQATAGRWTVYDCKLATPLYGGGVRAGVVDQELPIRPSAIRGQLRFWWRLIRRAQQRQLPSRDLFREECEIFGGITSSKPIASCVTVRVIACDAPECEPAHRYEQNPKSPVELKALPTIAPWANGYALFSAQGKRSDDKRSVEEQPKALARPGMRFRFVLGFDDRVSAKQRADVETALRWWASFGGFGARTRRGLGAVKVDGLSPISAADVQIAGGRLALLKPTSSAVDAWKTAVNLLQRFRQGVGVARNEGDEPNRPGRSRWPEADTLRHLSGKADPKHAVPVVLVRGFPRAAFGLPVVFHFKDQKDPGDHVLEPADLSADCRRDRMASPLILRPYWDGDSWCPAALLLPGWQAAIAHPLKFRDQHYTPLPWHADAAGRAARPDDIGPLKGRGDDALSAFMEFFSKGGK
jgi:CRISPR-associated protein Cmr1